MKKIITFLVFLLSLTIVLSECSTNKTNKERCKELGQLIIQQQNDL